MVCERDDRNQVLPRSLFDGFDSVRIVSLRTRTDRRRAILKELEPFSLGEKVRFFDGYELPDRGPFLSKGSHGCYRSHLEILKEAGQAGESVLVLQDDCAFLPEIRDYRLPPCDIFYGGFEATDPDDPANSGIIGAHFMGFGAVAAAQASVYLTALLDPAYPPDLQAAAEPGFNPAIRPPIDGALVWFRRAHPALRTVFALLSYQRSSRSDITPATFVDRIPFVRNGAELARRLKSRAGSRSDSQGTLKA
jgi:glycosyl transferase family 25